jgi:hypothetical protein
MRRSLMFSVSMVLSVAVVAAFALSAWALYSSHRQSCQSRNTTLDVLHDVLAIATTPDPKHPPTPSERIRIAEFNAAVFARINKARCK